MALSLEHVPFPGIGNTVIFCSQYYKWCQLNGVEPVLYTKTPEKIVGINKKLFRITTEQPEHTVDIPCSLVSCFNIGTCGYMHKILDLPTVDLPIDIKAGFCFRLGDPKFDNEFIYMNERCIEKMFSEMSKYTRVFVCSNNNKLVRTIVDKFGSDKIFTLNDINDPDMRFSGKHLEQWVALSKCPIVYHHVKTMNSKANELTTTFAPTAAVYGGCEVVGIDNVGNIFYKNTYHW